ncbi:MAG: hypothetical protein EA380_08560, partial [Phycisphaeraceae bacterium]
MSGPSSVGAARAAAVLGAIADGSGLLRRPDWDWDACTVFGVVPTGGPIPAFATEETSMMRFQNATVRLCVPFVVLAALCVGGVCRGQVFVGGAGGAEPSLDARTVGEYARILELDVHQLEAMEAIRAAAARELQRVRVERTELSDDLRAEASEMGDFSILAGEMPQIQERFRREAEGIE